MGDINVHGDARADGGTVNVGGTINNYYNGQPTPPPRKLSVFLSYARADDDPNYDDTDKSFMRRLHNGLKDQFNVWWDRVSMPSRSLSFTSEIERAIRDADRFVLVVGPAAVASEYVRAEWEFALSICKPIALLLRNGDFKIIPEELASISATDFRTGRDEATALKVLINQLNADAPLGPTVNVKPLPEKGYVMRRRPFVSARAALLADEINPTVVSTPSATALFGLGGIGKSTLAAALAMDCTIRRQFPDGVLWIDVGQTPTLPDLQRQIGVFFGDSADKYQNESNATFALSAALQRRQALIILDDVWNSTLVERFPVTGTACRLLITTRSSQLAIDVEGADIRLDVLMPDEGAQLIAGRAGGSPDDPRYKAISEKLGGHTLAVTLAAAQIVRRVARDADDLLRLVDKRMQGTEPFRDLTVDKQHKDKNLALSLELSYNALTPELQQRFRALGIFPLESTFDLPMLAAVWDDDPDDAQLYLADLLGNVLIEPAAEIAQKTASDEDTAVEEETEPRYRQHNLLRAYARALLDKAGETEAIFGGYADFVITHSEAFFTFSPEQWGILDPLLSHVQEVGDNLVQRWQIVASHDGDEALLSLYGEFAVNIRKYVTYRPQMIQIQGQGQSELRGLRWLEMGLAVYKQQGNQQREALILNHIALAWSNLGEKQKALEYYNQTLTLYRIMRDLGGEATTLNNIGLTWRALAEPLQALEYYEQALPLRRTISDRRGEATTLTNIGVIWYTIGEKHKALEYYEQALPIFHEVGDKSGEATIMNNIGLVWSDFNEKHEALRYYEQALPLRRAIGDRRGEAAILHNIGTIYWSLGEQQHALNHYYQAVYLKKQVGDKWGEAATLSAIGAAFHKLRQLHKALEYYEQALLLLHAVGDREGEARTLNNLASIYFHDGKLAKALETFRQIINIVQNIGAVADEAAYKVNLAYTLYAMQQTADAIQEQEQAIAILQRHNLPYDASGVSVGQLETTLAQWRSEIS